MISCPAWAARNKSQPDNLVCDERSRNGQEMDGETFLMKNNETIPIPVRIRKQMKELYGQYLHENEEKR